MESNKQEETYMNINPDIPISEIPSLCMNCHEEGITRLLLTKIPFFKDVILMSFSCEKCGYRSNEVQSATNLADYGIKYELKITNRRDLDRRIVKTEFAEIDIPACGLEIPSKTQKGKLSTIEGFLSCARDDMLAAYNDGVYDTYDESVKKGVKNTIDKLSDVLEEKTLPVTLILTDPSGNSFIENPYAPSHDVYCHESHFIRTREMAEAMGYSIENQIEENKNVISTQDGTKKGFEVYKSQSHISAHLMDMTSSIKDTEGSDAIVMPEQCMTCKLMGENRVCVISIPFFKELIITCFSCDHCGFKSSEVKGGGGISDKGTKITVKVNSQKDLNRDLFKSETSQIVIPELEFESSMGSLGSMFTTIEGLIDKLIQTMRDTPFTQGDSSDNSEGFKAFIAKLEGINGSNFIPFTLIIDDPISNSFIFSINHENPENDKQMIIEEYERNWEQNEDLGINDMKTDNYCNSDEDKKKLEEMNKLD